MESEELEIKSKQASKRDRTLLLEIAGKVLKCRKGFVNAGKVLKMQERFQKCRKCFVNLWERF
jgi:hypothetical protein